MLLIHNVRTDAFDNDKWQFNQMDCYFRVPATKNYPEISKTRFVVEIEEGIDISYLIARPIHLFDGSIELTPVGSSPNPGQFRIVPTSSMTPNLFEFNEEQKNKIITGTCFVKGGIVSGTKMNQLLILNDLCDNIAIEYTNDEISKVIYRDENNLKVAEETPHYDENGFIDYSEIEFSGIAGFRKIRVTNIYDADYNLLSASMTKIY